MLFLFVDIISKTPKCSLSFFINQTYSQRLKFKRGVCRSAGSQTLLPLDLTLAQCIVLWRSGHEGPVTCASQSAVLH